MRQRELYQRDRGQCRLLYGLDGPLTFWSRIFMRSRKESTLITCITFCFIFVHYTYCYPHYIISVFYTTNIHWGFINAWLCSGPWNKIGQQNKNVYSYETYILVSACLLSQQTTTPWKQGSWFFLNLLYITTFVAWSLHSKCSVSFCEEVNESEQPRPSTRCGRLWDVAGQG